MKFLKAVPPLVLPDRRETDTKHSPLPPWPDLKPQWCPCRSGPRGVRVRAQVQDKGHLYQPSPAWAGAGWRGDAGGSHSTAADAPVTSEQVRRAATARELPRSTGFQRATNTYSEPHTHTHTRACSSGSRYTRAFACPPTARHAGLVHQKGPQEGEDDGHQQARADILLARLQPRQLPQGSGGLLAQHGGLGPQLHQRVHAQPAHVLARVKLRAPTHTRAREGRAYINAATASQGTMHRVKGP
jgi:hypothetical protein